MRAPSAIRALLALLSFGALTGCGSMYTYQWPLSSAAPPSGRPLVYFEGSLPSAGLQELEMVEAIGGGTHANVDDVVHAMQDDAQAYGANAIVRVRVDCGHGTCHGYGVAVRFVGPPPQP
jgi:hypothetical protein